MRRTISFATILFAAACVRPGSSPTVQTVPAVAPPSAPQTVQPAPSTPVVQQASPAPAPVKTATVSDTAGSADSIRVTTSDVARRATEVFGDDSAATTAAADSAAGPSWDIAVREYESTDRVEHYVQLFSGRAKEHVEQQLQRGTRYESMIRAKMREGGLPEDMYYLALIESGFDPNAYSRAAAVGMWQFMTSTARDMGLRVDWWIDERRDPVKSTVAAVKFIKGLREQFGSLYLAAAAYNGGPGRIARGLTRYADDLEGTSGEDQFFVLAEKDYLRTETRDYVPQLIAAALIAKEPARYGLKFTTLPPFAYDSVRVGAATPLAAIAHASDTAVDAIRELNPQVLRGMTPPHDSTWIRIPPGAADSFAVRFADLPKSEKLGLFTVESKKGQTLDAIAERNGISAHALALYNPTLKRYKSGRLVPGQTVLIPTVAVAHAAASVPDPAIERYGSSSSRTVAVHIVKSGETVSGIAKKYHTTTDALMKRNGLKKPLIFPGQSLIVSGGSASARVSSSRSRERSTKAAKSSKSSKKESVAKKPSASKAHTPAKKSASSTKKQTAKKSSSSRKTSVAKSSSKKPKHGSTN
jgi:membrane-bound lytic murein transglycosylase D